MKPENFNSNFDQSDCLLSPGEAVQQSGIYQVCHADEERSTVIMVRHTILPYCRQCGDQVRYKVQELAPHISEDPDFQEHVAPADNPAYQMRVPNHMVPAQLSRAHGFRFHQDDALQARPVGSHSGDL
jgi:hypothetical protein